jgi:hypothetical protein
MASERAFVKPEPGCGIGKLEERSAKALRYTGRIRNDDSTARRVPRRRVVE